MNNGHEFHPDWVSAPGDTIADILTERGLSIAEFAENIGHTVEQTTDLLQGRASITIAIARTLERLFGASVAFWMSRDFQYRQDAARLNATADEWLTELPLGDMIKFGWLKPPPRPSEEVAECLRFFNVPNLQVWREAYQNLHEIVAFRTSHSFESRPAAVAAWLRQGEIESEAIECNPWNPVLFRDSLASARSLTRQKDPSRFIPELRKLCAASGVALAIVRAPNGCRASGATSFVSSRKALLLLSFRHLSDDQFWFTFFHEAGHLLLHNKKRLFLEDDATPATQEEHEANEFAGCALVPPDLHSSMLCLPIKHREIIRFARRAGVSPGIIVGQLQHYKRIDPSQLNILKRRFRWSE
jgi:HTH-type transcriptional regulator/antitoxin HigA